MGLRRLLRILLCAIFASGGASANTGAFFGAANQVVPIKEERVRLVREDVSMVLTIDPENPVPGFEIPYLPWVNVKARFWLQNLTTDVVSVQLGFPFFDLQGFGDEEFVLSNLNFIASGNDQIRDVELREGILDSELDPNELFNKVFV